jgi:dephospho-CoA kinase
VKRVAVAGGIGAGKSAAAAYLRERGFHVVDADVTARRVVQKGEPAWRALRDAFGTGAFVDGELDRAFLADVVFSDESARRRLNAITHGYIGEEILKEMSRAEGDVVFVELPLFRPEHRRSLALDEAWAIQVSPATALERLTTLRGLSSNDALARLATQMGNDERGAIVDVVLWNEGSLVELAEQLNTALERVRT